MFKLPTDSRLRILGLTVLAVVVVAVYFLLVRGGEESAAPAGEQAAAKEEETTAHLQGDEARNEEPEETDEGDPIEQLRQTALSDPDPEERVRALQELAESEGGERAIAILLQALHNDRSGEAREAALEVLEEIQALSFETISRIALNDPAPSVRMRAIALVNERDEQRTKRMELLKRIAKSDRDKEVRQSAMDLLEAMQGSE